jgi:alpha-glucoside transport system substrate-binding protein
VGADVGWPLTDLFENIYLRTAGPDMYDQLARHEIPWTDQSVKDALTVMGDVFQPELMAGGTEGALQTDFNGSITQVWGDDTPQGAILFEQDAVGGIITDETDSKLGTDADFFDFPSIDGSPPSVVGGGDIAVLLEDTEGGKALIEYLASTEAAEMRAGLGGFISPNPNVDLSVYPDDVTRRAAEAFQEAGDAIRYDMSDLQPTEFGATTGRGMWGIMIDFLGDPSDVDGTANALEAAAKKAYGD